MSLSRKISPQEVQKRMASIYPTDPMKVCLKCSARDDWIRFVTHWENNDEDIRQSIEKIVYVLKEFDNNIRQGIPTNLEQLERAYRFTESRVEAQNKKAKL